MMYRFLLITLSLSSLCSLSHGQAKNQSTPASCGPNGLCTYGEVLAKMGECFNEDWKIEKAQQPRKSRPITTLFGLEMRLQRQMEALSIRVLRGVRRIEKEMNEIVRIGVKAPYIPVEKDVQNMQPLCPQQTVVQEPKPRMCPSFFEGIEEWDQCYLFSNFNTTWQHAWDYCLALDANLVTIETNKEHFLINLMGKQRKTLNDVKGWWTAGHYMNTKKQWNWTSAQHLKPIKFHKWQNGVPSAEATVCMVIPAYGENRWTDDDCVTNYNFICEAPKLNP